MGSSILFDAVTKGAIMSPSQLNGITFSLSPTSCLSYKEASLVIQCIIYHSAIVKYST